MSPAGLQDWFEINNLFIRYTTALDRGDLDGVAGCFAENGVIESPLMGTFRGHAGARDFAARAAQTSRERNGQFRHVVSNLVAEVAGDRAHATCYLLDYFTADEKTELLSPGEYNCDLVRVDGRWLFELRKVVLDQTFPLKMPGATSKKA